MHDPAGGPSVASCLAETRDCPVPQHPFAEARNVAAGVLCCPGLLGETPDLLCACRPAAMPDRSSSCLISLHEGREDGPLTWGTVVSAYESPALLASCICSGPIPDRGGGYQAGGADHQEAGVERASAAASLTPRPRDIKCARARGRACSSSLYDPRDPRRDWFADKSLSPGGLSPKSPVVPGREDEREAGPLYRCSCSCVATWTLREAPPPPASVGRSFSGYHLIISSPQLDSEEHFENFLSCQGAGTRYQAKLPQIQPEHPL